MEIADTVAGCLLLGGAFISFTAINYRILFMKIKKAEKIPSPAPFIGGIAGALLVVCLIGFEQPLLLAVPLIIDPGSVPLVIWLIICIIRDSKNGH